MAIPWLKILTESKSLDIDAMSNVIKGMIANMPEHLAYEVIQRYTLYEHNREIWTSNRNNGIDYEKDVQYYLKSSDPAPLFAPFLHFEGRFDITRRYIRHYWPLVEEYALRRQDKVHEALSSKSVKIAEILKTREGFGFVEYAARRMYDILYAFAVNSPRFHGAMKDGRKEVTNFRKATRFPRIDEVKWTDGGWIMYGPTAKNSLVSTTFFCSKCGKTFPDMEAVKAETVLVKIPWDEGQ